MSEYVDIDIDVERYVTTWECNCSDFGRQEVMSVDDLRYLTTADVKEVVHGEWIKQCESYESNEVDWSCSHCKEIFTIRVGMHPIKDCEMFFCPHCGADMRGEKNGK